MKSPSLLLTVDKRPPTVSCQMDLAMWLFIAFKLGRRKKSCKVQVIHHLYNTHFAVFCRLEQVDYSPYVNLGGEGITVECGYQELERAILQVCPQVVL